MMEESKGFRSGFVAVIGRSNVGKSTLTNALLGTKLSIVSNKPQTTRNRILGVRHLDNGQIILLDTPGIHKPKFLLNRRMLEYVRQSLESPDIVYLVADVTQSFGSGDRYVLSIIGNVNVKTVLVLNKIDLIQKEELLPLIDSYRGLHDFLEIIPVSAMKNINLDRLLDCTLRNLPEGPEYFPPDFFTDRPEEFLIQEFIREQVVRCLSKELPYATAVKLERFIEEENIVFIDAFIYVEKESQKKIVIGAKGSMAKKISTNARISIEELLNKKVHLQIWAKVKDKWRSDERTLRSVGLVPEDGGRI